jgi:hypothetical protein
VTLTGIYLLQGYIFYDYGEFEGRVPELREWSYTQPKYYNYYYNTDTIDSCAYSWGIFQNFEVRKKLEARINLNLSWRREFELQDTFENIKFKHGVVCNPNTPYYIYSETEDSLWVKVVTFGYREKVVQKGKFRWGYAYKPHLRTKPPDKDKDCTRKNEIPVSWDR